MSIARLMHYQGLLLDSPRIIFLEPAFLNPAILLPNLDMKTPLHDCCEILSEVTQARHDLLATPLRNGELTWFTDGSSFVKGGVRKARVAVADHNGNVIWSSALHLGTSAQKAELIAQSTQTAGPPSVLCTSTVPSTESGAS